MGNWAHYEKRVCEFVNERKAGRKSKFSELEKETIGIYGIKGKTIKL